MSFHPLVHMAVRRGAIKGLMQARPELGWLAARHEVFDETHDADIDATLTTVGLTPPVDVAAAVASGPVAALGDGAILKWISEHWDQIAAAIKMFVSLLLLFL